MINSLNKDLPISLVALFIIFSLHYFGYLYFFDFDEGVSSAPFIFKAIKDAFYIIFLISIYFLTPKASLIHRPEQFVFLPFCASLVIISLLHSPQTGLFPQIWENIKNVAIYIPVYMIAFTLGSKVTKVLFGCILGSALIQSGFSFAFSAMGGVLWLDKGFAGLLGNPNSFALFLNLAACVMLAYLPAARALLLAIILMGLSVVALTMTRTESGSQIVILCFLVVYATIFNLKSWLRYVGAALVIAAAFLAQPSHSVNATYALGVASSPANEAMFSEPAETSISVSTRVEQAKQALGILTRSPLDALFGSFEASEIFGMDGQIWHFLYYGGLLTLLSFAVPAVTIYWRSTNALWRDPSHPRVALHLMMTAFGITLLASRVLMYFPFNFLFFLVCGLVAATLGHTGSVPRQQSLREQPN